MGLCTQDFPEPTNYAQQTSDTLRTQIALYPEWLQAETKYGPQSTANSLRNLEQYLMGTPGGAQTVNQITDVQGYRNAATGQVSTTMPEASAYGGGAPASMWPGSQAPGGSQGGRGSQPGTWEPYTWQTTTPTTVQTEGQRGLLDLYQKDIQPALSDIEAQTNARQRAADIADVTALGPAAYEAARGFNPQQTALMDALNARAQQELALGGQMTPDQRRAIENQVLGQRSAAGWGYNPGDLAQAGMRATGVSDTLKANRQGFASQTAGLNQSVYGDPFLQVLGRSGQAFGAMGGIMNQAAGNATGDLFNPESSYAGNLANSNLAYGAMTADPSFADQLGTFQNVSTMGLLGKGGSY